MSDATNPYEPPMIQADSAEDIRADQNLVPASKGLRFANLVIDYIAQSGLAIVLGIVIVLIWGEQGADFIEGFPDIAFGIPILLIYYLALEGTTSRTLGKLVTGTRVVNEDSEKPTFGQVVGRTFARLIPFEAFSFLGESGRGWHDSLPKTYVVKIGNATWTGVVAQVVAQKDQERTARSETCPWCAEQVIRTEDDRCPTCDRPI